MDAAKDLELLIRSRYLSIAVETHEEDRVEATLQRIATQLGMPFSTWTSTEGLRRRGGIQRRRAWARGQPPW